MDANTGPGAGPHAAGAGLMCHSRELQAPGKDGMEDAGRKGTWQLSTETYTLIPLTYLL